MVEGDAELAPVRWNRSATSSQGMGVMPRSARSAPLLDVLIHPDQEQTRHPEPVVGEMQ